MRSKSKKQTGGPVAELSAVENIALKHHDMPINWTSIADRELIRLGQLETYYQHAMVELWNRYKKRLYMYIKYKTSRSRYVEESREKYIIEDILQNVFCDVLENLSSYLPRFEVSTWVYTITNKHIVRYVREVQKYHGRTLDLNDDSESNVFMSHDHKPDQVFELKEFERIVLGFVQSLKRGTDQDVFILYLQNLHTKNIAERMKNTQDATRARLNRVIKRFKMFLRKRYPEYVNSISLSQIKNLNIAVQSSGKGGVKVRERDA